VPAGDEYCQITTDSGDMQLCNKQQVLELPFHDSQPTILQQNSVGCYRDHTAFMLCVSNLACIGAMLIRTQRALDYCTDTKLESCATVLLSIHSENIYLTCKHLPDSSLTLVNAL